MEVSEVTTNLASWSLTRILEQQSFIAQNIANANVSGYRAVHADFSKAVSQLQDLQGNHNAMANHLESADLSASMKYQAQGLLSDKVELDKETMALFKNSSQYNGIVELLNRNFGLMKLAINSRR